MAKTQDNTFISLKTPLGRDALIVESFVGVEELSSPFVFELDLVSEDPSIAFDKLVGQRVTLIMEVMDGTPMHRYVNGIVSRFVQRHSDSRYTFYRAEVVPWLWLLSRQANCRIFQEMTVPEIVKQVFHDRGQTDFEDRLQGSYPKLTYCVQYRERDIDFVSRLLEEYGITYFFKHDKERHTLVLADAPGAFEPCPHQARVRFREDSRLPSPLPEPGVVTELSLSQELHAGKYSHTDYNFETPSNDLRTSAPTRVSVGGNTGFEIYDYPGRYAEVDVGEKVAKLRIEEGEAPHLCIDAMTTCRALLPGFRFDLVSHYRGDVNRGYLVVRVEHRGVSGELSEGTQTYTNRLHAVPADAPFRPQRRTPKPVVQGPQTAVVVGPAGDEIHTDKYGRVKVHFHWDRLGKRDEKSSCWVRVSQHWAGSGFGSIFIPRIGQEVVVDFLEGDPDQPFINGRVYNAEQMPPYSLPAERTKSGVKTNSSKGGGGSNELRFEDKKGSEEIYLHAQKDLNEVVENNHSTSVKADQSNSVSGKQTVSVTKDQTITVSEGNRKLTVEKGTYDIVVAQKAYSLTVANSSCTVGSKAEMALSSGSSTLTATAKQDVTLASETAMVTITGKKDVSVQSESANLSLGAPAGNADLFAQSKLSLHAKEIEIGADQKITLAVGGNSIVIDQGKIEISGIKITSAAQAIQEISGALVKIN